MVQKTGSTSEQLELTSQQTNQLRSAINDLRNNAIITDRFAAWRLEQLIAGEMTMPGWMTDWLVPAQFQWLAQTEFQFRTAAWRDSFGLMYPGFLDSLSLSEDQQQSLIDITSKYSQRKQEQRIEFEVRKSEIEGEYRLRAIAVLDEAQLNRIKRLVSQ